MSSQTLQKRPLSRGKLLLSLSSTLCPACGGFKEPGRSFCRPDYYSLTRPIRQSLYCNMGHGYEYAMEDAFAELNVNGPHWVTEI